MHFRILALLFALGVAPLPAVAQERVGTLGGLDRCTVVAVVMLDSVDSATAKAGDFFRLQTVDAVTDGSQVVIPARTKGYGVVSIASPAGRAGRPGSLVLEPRYLTLADGKRLGVVLDHNTTDLQKNGASGNMPGYLGAIPIPGMGIAIGAFNYLHHGRDIQVPKGTFFAVFPSDDPSVQKCQEHPVY
jgi:hypothetical protein